MNILGIEKRESTGKLIRYLVISTIGKAFLVGAIISPDLWWGLYPGVIITGFSLLVLHRALKVRKREMEAASVNVDIH